jgi:pyruvate/2-oxoglutarate dehydrogenase complex dihydrolipoamide dehydrogenase (E3) component
VELAQAFQRLGITTTLVERGPQLLARDEPALVAALTRVLVDEGVDVLTDTEAVDVRRTDDGVALRVRTGSVTRELTAAALVVTAGRRPSIDGLGLDELGIETTSAGIVVDERARTTFRSVYAVGDATDGERFTHAAEHAAGRAVRDMFFPGRAPIAELVPWCTFTDPELAHAGLTIAEAEARHGDDVDVWRVDLDHNDRLRTDAEAGGAIVVVTAKDRIVGAHVLAPGAGEIIHELALAIDRRLDIDDLAGLVHVHPTVSTGIGMLAAESLSEKAQRYRWLVRRR